ncbi:MAG: GldG family protein, partial [Spirochaetaceae bacterium]|nr:GldG family protein [Spirochaetaceae bacterium]
MDKKQTAIITALSLAVLALALMVSSRLWFRLDLTKNKVYTISSVSRELSREIPGELRITYFVSDQLKNAYAIPGEIEDILREYAAHSRGKIRVAVKDPVESGMEYAVEELGIPGRQMQVVDRNQTTVAVVYSGILIEYLDKSSVIAWVGGSETIEYDLTTRIRSLLTEAERHVGIVVGDNSKIFDNDYNYVSGSLRDAGYRVSVVYPDYEVPDTLPVLFVFGGSENLSESALYRIDRYIQLGGKVLFAADALVTDGQPYVNPVENSGLLAMLKTYGVTIEAQLALDTSSNIIQAETPGAPGRIQLIRYPFWVSVMGAYGNPGQPITSTFAGLDLYWPSPLTLNAPTGVTADVLFTTTEDAWLQTGNFNIQPAQSWGWLTEREATLGVKTLGAALTGTFPRNFQSKPSINDNGDDGGNGNNGNDGVNEDAGDSLPDMPDAAKEARIVVIG